MTQKYSKSILKSLAPYVKEHFANAAYGVYPIESNSKVAIIIVANRYSPNNFWYDRLPKRDYGVTKADD